MKTERILTWLVGAVAVHATWSCTPPFGDNGKAEAEIGQALVRQRAEEENARAKLEASRERDRLALADKKEREEKEAKQRAEEDRIANHVYECDASRAERVAHAKKLIREFQSWLSSEKPRIKYFDAHCEIYDSRGVKISREHVRDGVILRTSSVGVERDVKCDGAPGRPPGITPSWLRFTKERLSEGTATRESNECLDEDARVLGVSLGASFVDEKTISQILNLPSAP